MSTAPRFLTTLQVRRADDGRGGAWELVAPLVYCSDILPDTVVVPTGFRTDFASVPRVPVAYLLFADIAQEAAVVHDYLYTNMVSGVTRKQADQVLAEASKALGVAAWRRGPMWLAVRWFGGSHWGAGSPLPVADVIEVAEDVRD